VLQAWKEDDNEMMMMMNDDKIDNEGVDD